MAGFVGVSVVRLEQPARICQTMHAVEGSVGIDTKHAFGTGDVARCSGESSDDLACPRGVRGRIRRSRRRGRSELPGAPAWVPFLAELCLFTPSAPIASLGRLFDDADQLIDVVTVAACEIDEFSSANNDRALLGATGHGDATAAAKFHQSLVSQ